MTSNNNNMNEEITCSVCGIRKTNGVFYYSHNYTPATPDAVKTRICQFAKKEGCINQTAKVDPAQGYGQLPPSGIDFNKMAQEILNELNEPNS
jgi:hypothetical protein